MWHTFTRILFHGETEYRLELDYHLFPVELDLKGNANDLMAKISWLAKGLSTAFSFNSTRQLSEEDFQMIIQKARELAYPGRNKPSLTVAAEMILKETPRSQVNLTAILEAGKTRGWFQPNLSEFNLNNAMLQDGRFNKLGENLWMLNTPPLIVIESRLPASLENLADYLSIASRLENKRYSDQEILDIARSIFPDLPDNVFDLATELAQFRLVLPASGESREVSRLNYEVASYVQFSDGQEGRKALLKLMALALLKPDGEFEGGYELPALHIVPHLLKLSLQSVGNNFAPELGTDEKKLLDWYAQAGLVVLEGANWRVAPDAFNPLAGSDDPAVLAYNDFLAALIAHPAGATGLPEITQNGNLPPLSKGELDQRLAELGQKLLIDPQVVRRIYRSLMAGRHVVLSGPPGTGKTELAKLLPRLLWGERKEHTKLTFSITEPPLISEIGVRQGYLPVVVTATEDWGVRDLIGGIGPELSKEGGSLNFSHQYGHLTRTILKNYLGEESEILKDVSKAQRGEYTESDQVRYRGAWLVIDEFTRAPIDAAFGSLLTTLSGSSEARLSVPTPTGEASLPLPRDFRVIGTLNSFDRHFLNQISEALKRRFDFIDVLPPLPAHFQAEQGIAINNALRKLRANGFETSIQDTAGKGLFSWIGVLEVTVAPEGYSAAGLNSASRAALESFWRIFAAIRVFRQLGTAQAEAVYLNLFSGVLAAGMDWPESLDTALADTLADQLQVLNRDEQWIILAYLEKAHDDNVLLQEIKTIISRGPSNRRMNLLRTFKEVDLLRSSNGSSDIKTAEGDEKYLSLEQIHRIFQSGQPLALTSQGVFTRRLNNLAFERGL